MAEATQVAPTPTATPYAPGAFVWHELATRDVKAAESFYTQLFGWTVQYMPMGGPDNYQYPLITANGIQIGGIADMNFMQIPAEVPSHFYGYVSVPDVDAAAEVAAKAGGKVLAPAMDIPNVGRFAILQDPQGGVFALLRSLHGDPDQNRIPGNGEFCWDSLHTSDINGAISFYNKVIGWTTKPGPEGMTGGVFMQGDLMEASYDGLPMPEVPTHWMTNIAVNDLKASVKKAQELGATILMDGIEIPFGTFSVVRDPQGAHFAMFQGKQQ